MSHKQIIQDWKVEISCSQREVGESFSVFIFLGDIPADPTQWLFDPSFVGTFDIYTYTSSTPYESHSYNDEGGNSMVNGSVHLNRAILRLSRQQSLEEDPVLSFLRRKLNWGVQKVDGETIALGRLPSLQVTVQRTPLIKTSPDSGYPTEGKPVYYHDITRGKPGGYCGGQY